VILDLMMPEIDASRSKSYTRTSGPLVTRTDPLGQYVTSQELSF